MELTGQIFWGIILIIGIVLPFATIPHLDDEFASGILIGWAIGVLGMWALWMAGGLRRVQLLPHCWVSLQGLVVCLR